MDRVKLAISTWNEQEYDAIQAVIDSGNFTMGKKVNEFEKAFSKYIGKKYSVMVNSGSSANLLMVYSLIIEGKLNKGDEVIVPAVSWSTTFSPLQQFGLKLKFIDIDLKTLNLDLNILEQAITSKTKAIFLVNLLGNPVDIDRVESICQNKDIVLLEDNCESLGAEIKGRKTGNFGYVSSHSFFFSHHISTMEGGMISTDSEELFYILKSLRAHGWTRDLPLDSSLYTKSKDSFYELFNFIMPGFNVRPLEMSGAIGVEQLKKLDSLVKERQKNAKFFKKIFNETNQIIIQQENGKSSWFGFSLINRNKNISSTSFREKLLALGFEIRPIVAGNFLRNKAIEYFDYEVFGEMNNADFLHDNGVFIGNNSIDITHNLKRLEKLLA